MEHALALVPSYRSKYILFPSTVISRMGFCNRLWESLRMCATLFFLSPTPSPPSREANLRGSTFFWSNAFFPRASSRNDAPALMVCMFFSGEVIKLLLESPLAVLSNLLTRPTPRESTSFLRSLLPLAISPLRVACLPD